MRKILVSALVALGLSAAASPACAAFVLSAAPSTLKTSVPAANGPQAARLASRKVLAPNTIAPWRR